VIGLAALGTAAALVLAAYWMGRRRPLRLSWDRVHQVLTVAAVIMLLFAVSGYRATLVDRPVPVVNPGWAASVAQPPDRPDIYLVIADGHGRDDILRTGYGYDASPFVLDLESLGFDVSKASWANYPFTQPSLASFYSGSHLADLGVDMSEPPDGRRLSATLRDNPPADLLRRLGYWVVGISSGFDHVPERGLDAAIDTGQMSELEQVLLRASAMGTWVPQIVDEAWRAAGYERTVDSLTRLARIAREPHSGARAVFVHLPLPHEPYAVGRDCEPIAPGPDGLQLAPPNGPGTARTVQLAADQTRCVDRLLAPVLAEIVDADPRAIIILMSDHGPDERLDWSNPSEPGVSDRLACFLAVRTPGKDRLLPDDVSLVNVLPTLFNAYFGTALPIRPDDVFMVRSILDGRLVRREVGVMANVSESLP
jgi:hypothetical protein